MFFLNVAPPLRKLQLGGRRDVSGLRRLATAPRQWIPCEASHRSASMAALHPSPAAETACL